MRSRKKAALPEGLSAEAIAWKGTALGREQYRALKGRVDRIRGARYRGADNVQKTAKELAAERVIAAYDKRVEKAREKRDKEVREAVRKADDAVLFAENVRDAKAAVERLEAVAKKKGWIRD